ncbi:MAG TPA: CBS domain-containing protein [Rickettsiales bacterium]|nr:CBS domain-containing protein [Rickettsiales bacterium]
MQTQVKELMKRNFETISSDATLKEAAERMRELECGALPVSTEGKLAGMITDRDIVIRAIPQVNDVGSARVRDYMTTSILSCSENDTLEQAAEKMQKTRTGRLLVKDSTGKVCGIITLGCILRKHQDLKEVSKVVACATGKMAA